MALVMQFLRSGNRGRHREQEKRLSDWIKREDKVEISLQIFQQNQGKVPRLLKL